MSSDYDGGIVWGVRRIDGGGMPMGRFDSWGDAEEYLAKAFAPNTWEPFAFREVPRSEWPDEPPKLRTVRVPFTLDGRDYVTVARGLDRDVVLSEWYFTTNGSATLGRYRGIAHLPKKQADERYFPAEGYVGHITVPVEREAEAVAFLERDA